MEAKNIQALLRVGGLLIQDENLREQFELAADDVGVCRSHDMKRLAEYRKSQLMTTALESLATSNPDMESLEKADTFLTIAEVVSEADPVFWRTVLARYSELVKAAHEEAARSL